MSFIDRALNAATDAAKSSAAGYQRSQRRRALDEQILAQQQTIHWSLVRIGRLSMETDAGQSPLPAAAQPAADAARRWQAELIQLQQSLLQLDQLPSEPPTGPRAYPPPDYGVIP
jgi:hypothetical protein